MIKTIIVDSDPVGLEQLQLLIDEYCDELKVVARCSDAETAKKKIALLKPELVFLDVSVPGKSGFDLLSDMDSIPFEIIFVTASVGYSLQAFKYGAVDYLMKPVEEVLLMNAVKRAEKKISSKRVNQDISDALGSLKKIHGTQVMKLCVPSLKGFRVINLDDIVYCEAETSYTIFHLTNGQQVMASRPIIEYEAMLQNTSFCRIHKSFMVNMSHIREYQRGEGGTVILTNSREVEVSRRKKDVFINKLKVLFKY